MTVRSDVAAHCREGRHGHEAKGHQLRRRSVSEVAFSAVTADRKRLRGRVLAFAGLWFLLSGLLTALSFVVIALVAWVLLLLGLLAVGAPRLLSRFGVRARLRDAVDSIKRVARRQTARRGDLALGRHARRVAVVAAGAAAGTRARAPDLVARAGQHYAAAVYRSTAVVSQILQRLSSSLASVKPRLVDRRRRALSLNERGTHLRRAGHPEQAAEQHRAALAIVRELGDQHAEALTLNSLGLALAQGGAEAAALQRFEEALAVLRRLGDDEHEGQVIANLSLVHRREGRSEEAASLLHAALDKLPPESPAYRRVEQQLRRAS